VTATFLYVITFDRISPQVGSGVWTTYAGNRRGKLPPPHIYIPVTAYDARLISLRNLSSN